MVSSRSREARAYIEGNKAVAILIKGIVVELDELFFRRGWMLVDV